jgi:beta-lactamase regulating signal transducer with metallopeptidase domain
MSFSFLIEMGWKSALISGAALLLVSAMKGRSPADRGAVLKLGVAMLLALPAISLLLPALQVETSMAGSVVASPAAAATIDLPLAADMSAAAAPAPSYVDPAAADPISELVGAGDWNDPGSLFLLLYLGGLAMVAGRLVAGLWTLRRWTREAREVESPEWRAALRRAVGDRTDIRLLVSDEACSPMSWGWRRPVILLDRDSVDEPDDADAILAHETAHVLRRDWPALILSRVAVALFWFNPLVWRLDREVAQQAEEAADSHAIGRVEPARYAQTLLDWARQSGGVLVPANAIAAGEPGLVRRVKKILEGRITPRSGSVWTVLAMIGCVAIAAPVAALQLVPEAPVAPEAPAAPEAPLPPEAPAATDAVYVVGTPPAAPVPPVAPGMPAVPAAPATPHALHAMLAVPPAPAAPAPPAAPRAPVWIGPVAAAHIQAAAHARPMVDEDAIEREVEAAVERAEAQAEAAAEAAERVAEAAERRGEQAQRQGRIAMAAGARGMLKGADGMERGAANMRAQASRFRDRNYRERTIAKEAARGHHVTHEELIEAASEMDDGAREMLEGAREMRREAQRMARGDG